MLEAQGAPGWHRGCPGGCPPGAHPLESCFHQFLMVKVRGAASWASGRRIHQHCALSEALPTQSLASWGSTGAGPPGGGQCPRPAPTTLSSLRGKSLAKPTRAACHGCSPGRRLSENTHRDWEPRSHQQGPATWMPVLARPH